MRYVILQYISPHVGLDVSTFLSPSTLLYKSISHYAVSKCMVADHLIGYISDWNNVRCLAVRTSYTSGVTRVGVTRDGNWRCQPFFTSKKL